MLKEAFTQWTCNEMKKKKTKQNQQTISKTTHPECHCMIAICIHQWEYFKVAELHQLKHITSDRLPQLENDTSDSGYCILQNSFIIINL